MRLVKPRWKRLMEIINVMMKDIAIFGAGGFGREVACLINIINEVKPTWNIIGFFDDGIETGTEVSHYGSVLGGKNELNEWNQPLSVVIAVGAPLVVKKIVEGINNPFIDFPNIIHPSFIVVDNQSFSIGKGNIIQRNCSVSCDVVIGDFNVLNGTVYMGHDDKIGSFNTFMPGVRVSGEVIVGEGNFFGVGSIVLQQIRIGNHIRLGAGSVLMTKPKDGNLYIGNPARKTEL